MRALTPKPLTEDFRAWIEQERSWGRHAVAAIARQRGLVLADGSGLERFTVRMALVELTGSVARWGNGLHEGLAKVNRSEAAAVFAVAPPFPATDPHRADYDHLSEHVETRMRALEELLAADRGERSQSAG
jgi:hypothetical protein